jgi:membrane associated rhomboid family serine protease
MERLRAELNEILAKASGQKLKKSLKTPDRDFYMTAEEAIEYGLADAMVKKLQPFLYDYRLIGPICIMLVPFSRSGYAAVTIVICFMIVDFISWDFVQSLDPTFAPVRAILQRSTPCPGNRFTYALIHYNFWHLFG